MARELSQSDDPRRDWRRINEVIREVLDLTQRLSNLSISVAELQRKRTVQEGGGGKVQRMRVTAAANDTLTCQKTNADGSLVPGGITVAKPQTLRVAFWLNQTIGQWRYTGSADSRTATYTGGAVAGGLQPGDIIGEILDPPWVGMDIFASEVEGGTGVAGVTWIDLNADARRFVAVRDVTTVCKVVSGVQTNKRLVLEGGPAV